MAITASPERESIFQQLKAKYGSRFLWHGSMNYSWHLIVREGLRNLSGTSFQRNGDTFCKGIYFAPRSHISRIYASYDERLPNNYGMSVLGDKYYVIALCEVIDYPENFLGNEKPKTKKIKSYEADVEVENEKGEVVKKMFTGQFNEFDWYCTLSLEEAAIGRFIFINLDKQIDTLINPPTSLPNLVQLLQLRVNASQNQNKKSKK